MTEEPRDGIAVIGIGCRFPGGAEDPNRYWDLLDGGGDAIVSVPGDRWPAGLPYYDGSSLVPGRTKGMRGGFLDDIAGWDARLFGVSEQEAQRIDPQQRLVMEVAWRAIEDAGIGLADFRAARTGVFAGVTDSQQFTRLQHQCDPPCVDDPYMAVGSSTSMAAGRLAFFLDAVGPAISVDTACSTSLVAVHLAMESLLRGECDLALVAAASAVIHPESFVSAHQIGMLASDGQCRAFDRHAGGFTIGEGGGAVLLERMADAVANRHRIRAVARGSAVNQNGRSDGITAPQRRAQADVIRQALARGAVAAEDVVFVEAHGAGTVLGDAIEVEALAEVFRPRDSGRMLHLGAVKTNLGHLLVAAGMAGLIKAVLVLEQRRIPVNINFTAPSPILRRTPWLQPVTSAVELDHEARPIVGVSSFGWSGTNAHVVLQAAPRPVPPEPTGTPYVLTLAAATPRALGTLAGELASHLERQGPELADVARTLQEGRSWHPARSAVVCTNAEEGVAACRSLAGQPPTADTRGGARVGLFFPGAGGARPAVIARLGAAFGSFRAAAEECRREFLAVGLDPLAVEGAAQHPPAVATNPSASDRAAAAAIEFTIGYALTAVLRDIGVQPAAIYGAAAAEYLAGCLAGVCSLDHAVRMAAACARLPSQATVSSPADGMWAAARDQLRRAVGSASLSRPAVPIVSAASGDWIAAATAQDPGYWARLPRDAAPLGHALDTLGANATVIAQVGPGGLLNGTAFPRPGAKPAPAVVPLLAAEVAEDRDDLTILLEGIARIWERGVHVAWSRAGTCAGQIVSLPAHPFERRRFWPSATDTTFTPAAGAVSFPGGADAGPGIRPLHCYTRTWRQPVTVARPAGSPPGTAVLFPAAGDPAGGLAAALAGRLRAVGWQVHLAPADLTAPGRADLLERAAAAADGARFQVIDCAGLGTPASEPGTDSVVTAFTGLMLTCQAISHSLAGRDVALVAAVSGAVEVVGGDAGSAAGGACTGLMSAISAEYPSLRWRVVDFDPVTVAGGVAAADSLADQVLAEIGSLASEAAGQAAGQGTPSGWPPDESLAAWRNGRRWVSSWAPAEIPPTPSPWRADGVYVITGGTRGLGMMLARHIARAGRPRLVLVGRTKVPPRSEWDAVLAGSVPASDRIRATITDVREIERRGAEAVVLSADVTDPGQMRSVLRAAEDHYGTVHGVVHCAGVPGGGLLDRKTAADAAAVISVKTGALGPLREAIEDGRLDFVVLYSSAVTALGGLGETDYAAANACLETFASANSTSRTRVLAVSWGPWQHDDWQPAAPADAPDLALATRRYRSEFGITADSGTALLDRLIGIASPNVLVLSEPLADARQRWAGLRDIDAMLTAPAEEGRPRPNLLAPYIPPGTPLQLSIAEIWQQYLGLERVGIDDPFFDLGGNSLMGISMLRRLERELGRALPPSLLFECPTVRELAAVLDEARQAERREPAPEEEPSLRRQFRASAVQARRRELQTRREAKT